MDIGHHELLKEKFRFVYFSFFLKRVKIYVMCVNCISFTKKQKLIATVGRALSPGGIKGKEKERKKEKRAVCVVRVTPKE